MTTTTAERAPAGADIVTRAHEFLSPRRPRRTAERTTWGQGDEGLAIFHETAGDEEVAEVRAAQAWQAERWAAGFGWITGPVEHGGAGLGDEEEAAYRAVEDHYDIPDMMPLRIGLGTVAPGVLAYGSEAQVREHVVGIVSGRLVACQLFSEPDAGSDLANVRTRAVRDGTSWVVSGQKVWSSNAHLADVGLALARTDPDGPKHASLTAFLVPMDAPGVTVRHIRQLTGGASFTEVFFDDVVLDDALRVGEVGAGWTVATGTLAAERRSVGDRSHGLMDRALTLLRMAPDELGVDLTPAARHALVDLHVRLRIARFHQQRMHAVPPDRLTGGERVLDKLLLTESMRRLGEAAGAVLGPRLAADTGEWGTYAWSRWVLGATGMKIGGGTDEVLKTMVAERVLGLPREPKPSSSSKEAPRG